jgi:hypothetical protein
MEDQDPAVVYENRNERIQRTIDILAENRDYDEFGRKAELARQYDLDKHRIHYVVKKYEDVIDWRRSANISMIDREAVEPAEQLDMASDGGERVVQVDFTLDEAFRAMRLLPTDLGGIVFKQIVSGESISQEGLDALFRNRDE